MSDDKMREEFEKFHRQHLLDIGWDADDVASEFDRKDNGDYVWSMAADGWVYWQASRQAIEVPTFHTYSPDGISYYDAEVVEEFLSESGLKRK